MAYADVVLARSPVSYWKLDDTSGTTAVDQVGANNLTYTSVTLNQSALLPNGDTDPSVLFGGVATSFAMKNPFTGFPTTNITVTALVRPSGLPKTSGIVTYASAGGGADDFRLYHTAATGGGQVRISVNGTNFDSAIASSLFFPNANRSRMVIGTWRSSDGQVQVWVDGSLISTSNIKTGYSFGVGGALVLAQDQDSTGGGFQDAEAYAGQLSDVAVFSSVLSDNDINDLFVAAFADTSIVPTISSVESNSLNQITVVFNKPVINATTTANWTSVGLTITNAVMDTTRTLLTLTTTGMSSGSPYTLVASSNIGDGTTSVANLSNDFTGNHSSAPTSDGADPICVFSFGVRKAYQDAISVYVNTTNDSGGEDTPTIYLMRAYRTLTPGYVYWSSTPAPDFVGTFSGYDPSELSDIIVFEVLND